jgi:hypothetical protein
MGLILADNQSMDNQMKLNQNQINALEKILDYVQESEFNSFLEFTDENPDNPEKHIYYHAMILMNLFNVNQD